MPRYIFKPRRGTASQWASATKPLQPDELGIEYTDDGTKARIIIGGPNGEVDAFAFSAVTKIRTISLPKSAWVGGDGTWSQVVTINGVTANSKIDLQPNASQLASLQDSETSFVAENNAKVVTVYAIGNLPWQDFEMQATITEVSE